MLLKTLRRGKDAAVVAALTPKSEKYKPAALNKAEIVKRKRREKKTKVIRYVCKRCLSFAEWCAVVRFRNVERSLKMPPGVRISITKNAAKTRSTVVNLVGARSATFC